MQWKRMERDLVVLAFSSTNKALEVNCVIAIYNTIIILMISPMTVLLVTRKLAIP